MIKFKIFKQIGSIIPIPVFRKILEFFKHYFIGLYKKIDEYNLFFAGAGIAYSLFLGMIPLILLVFSLLCNLFDVKTLQNQIFQIIDTVIPYPVYASYMKKVIETRLPEFVGYSTVAGYTGAIGLLITSTWIFSSMRTILNRIFHTTIQKNPFVGLLRDLGMVILLVIFITLSTFVFPIGSSSNFSCNEFVQCKCNVEFCSMGFITFNYAYNVLFIILLNSIRKITQESCVDECILDNFIVGIST